MLEELGMKDFKYQYIGKCIYNTSINEKKENHFFVVYVVYEVNSDQEPILNDEAESYKRFTKEELKKALKETPEIFGKAYFPIVENLYPELKMD